MIESVTERTIIFTFDGSHQIHVIRLFEARQSSTQIRLLFVWFRNQSFQNVPYIECHAYTDIPDLVGCSILASDG